MGSSSQKAAFLTVHQKQVPVKVVQAPEGCKTLAVTHITSSDCNEN
jgi:hypothetical protein